MSQKIIEFQDKLYKNFFSIPSTFKLLSYFSGNGRNNNLPLHPKLGVERQTPTVVSWEPFNHTNCTQFSGKNALCITVSHKQN